MFQDGPTYAKLQSRVRGGCANHRLCCDHSVCKVSKCIDVIMWSYQGRHSLSSPAARPRSPHSYNTIYTTAHSAGKCWQILGKKFWLRAYKWWLGSWYLVNMVCWRVTVGKFPSLCFLSHCALLSSCHRYCSRVYYVVSLLCGHTSQSDNTARPIDILIRTFSLN